jgi:hypothetical protein
MNHQVRPYSRVSEVLQAAVRPPFSSGARSPATGPFLGEPVLRMFLGWLPVPPSPVPFGVR